MIVSRSWKAMVKHRLARLVKDLREEINELKK